MTLIELSTEQPSLDSAPTAPPPAYAYRTFGLCLALLLVLALAGAVPPDAVRWQHAGLIALPADADYQIAGGRVFTLEIVDGRRVTSAWTIDPLRRLWRTTTTAQDSAGGLVQGGSSVAVDGDFVLLRSGPSTSVLDAHTGAVRWTSPLPLTALTGTIGLTQQEQFKAGTEYDESSGAPGALFFSSSGRPHTEPPLRTDLVGFDLATGRARWTTPFQGSIYPAEAHGVPGALIVVSSGELWLRAAADGSVLRSQQLPVVPSGGSSWADVVGDLVLVRQAGTITAYTTADLRKRWQRAEPAAAGNSATCAGLTCEKAGPRMYVLDPVTGNRRWRAARDVDLTTGAGYAIETRNGLNQPLRALDPATGTEQADLSGWQSVVLAAGTVVLSRHLPGGTTEFGLLAPGRRVVQPLGGTRSPGRDCAADARLVVCRAPAGLEVLRYAL